MDISENGNTYHVLQDFIMHTSQKVSFTSFIWGIFRKKGKLIEIVVSMALKGGVNIERLEKGYRLSATGWTKVRGANGKQDDYDW